jgi:hypothetical protein
MQRAHDANRLAKTLRGDPKRTAYSIKTTALVALSVRFPGQISVNFDRYAPKFVLVSNDLARFGLHAPAQAFSGGRI